MIDPISPATKALGFWSAILATVLSLAYDVGQIAEWLGWLGSRGGPHSTSSPLGLVVLLTPSLLLGPSFLALMIGVHQLAPRDRKVWSHTAVAFATVYATLICLVYFVQLTLVTRRLALGRMADIEVLRFVPFDSFLYSVDLLGYSFMSLATFFAAMVFTGSGLERIARLFLLANSMVLPFLVLQLYYPPLIWVAAPWAITFPGSTWTLALLFRRAQTATG